MCDFPSPEFYEERLILAARKAHQCVECFKPISPGERYTRVSGKWDGEVDNYHFHSGCYELVRYFPDEDGCFQFEVLREMQFGEEENDHPMVRRWLAIFRPEEFAALGPEPTPPIAPGGHYRRAEAYDPWAPGRGRTEFVRSAMGWAL